MEISFFAKSVLGDDLKSRLPMIHVFGIFLLLYSLERKVIFREEKELQRSKMYKAVCE